MFRCYCLLFLSLLHLPRLFGGFAEEAVVSSDEQSKTTWTANYLQKLVDIAITSGKNNTTIQVPPGNYYFYKNNFNITNSRVGNLSIVPAAAGGEGNVTFWFSGNAGINISHSTNVRIGGGGGNRMIVVDYDPPPPPQPTFREKSGITIHLWNCTRVVVEQVVIHAAPFMAITAFGGGGDHLLKRLFFEPLPGRSLVGVRDALHFSDLRRGPTIIDSTIGYTGDDFFNVHKTLLLVLECKGFDDDDLFFECLLVNPTVTTDGAPNTVYGTFSTPPFVLPRIDTMSFYHWPTTDMIMKPMLNGASVQSLKDVSSEYATEAQKILPPLLTKPPGTSWMEATNQTTKFAADEVWSVVLKTPTTTSKTNTSSSFSVMPPPVGSIVSIDTIASAGARFINNTFVHSGCNIGRLKSSQAIIQGNTFRRARIPNLELTALPQWFEGPVEIRDILVADNVFEGFGGTASVSPIHCGPLCEKPECHPGACPACPSCDLNTYWVQNVSLRNNTYIRSNKKEQQPSFLDTR